MSNDVVISIQDKISPNISTKLKAIAVDARTADAAVKALQRSLAITNQVNSLQALQTQLAKTSSANQQLAIQTQRLATAQAQTAAAQQRVIAATARAAQAQTQATTAVTQGAVAQQRLATQTANAATAQTRATAAAQRLQQAQQAGATSARSAADAIASYARSLAAIAGATLSAGAVIRAADAYTTLQNKLQTVSTSQAQVNTLMERLFELANRTRSGVEETTTAFARFDRALKLMGRSQDESLRLTETINKALIVSGATSAEASSALIQLSQAFNAGRLQGDEFRSVAENIPIVLDAIAKTMGVPVNQLKGLAAQGKITSQVLADSFALLQKQVDATFAKTVPTIGQAFVVLGNRAVKFFGELGQATGLSEAFSKAIISLSENLKAVTVVIVGVGLALYAAFGPSTIGLIASCTAAIKTFTLALASNPFGAVATVLATVITYLTLFRDEIKLGTNELTSLGDFFRATFEAIGRQIEAVSGVFRSLWAFLVSDAESALSSTDAATQQSSQNWINSISQFFETNRTGWAAALTIIARALDGITAGIRTLFAFAIRAMPMIVDVTKRAFVDAFNGIIGFIERVVNAEIEAFNKIRAAIGKAPLQLISFDKVAVDGAAKFDSIGKMWADSVTEGFSEQGKYFETELDALLKRAGEIAKQRAAQTQSDLRGAGVNAAGSDFDKNALKYAERRELALRKINTQLDNEINRAFQIQSQREAQARMDAIEESLISKRIKLTSDEYNAIMGKVRAVQQAIEVQRQFDAIYTESLGSINEYNASIEAARRLLELGIISQEQHSRAVIKSSEAYLNSQNAMRLYNRDLNQQLQLLQMLPKQREIEQQIMQVQNDLLNRGIVLNEKELSQLRQRLQLVQQMNAVSQQEQQILSGTVDRRKAFMDQLTAIDRLRKSHAGFDRSDAMTAIGNTEAGQFLVGSPEMLQAQVSQLDMMYTQIDALRKRDLISEQTAMAAKMQIWNAQQNAQLSSAKTFFGHLAAMQSSSNSQLAKIGKAAAIANAIINTYQAATGAYAAMASIPFVGPALGTAAAGAAIVAGMANVAAIRAQSVGFAQGGYTGDMPASAVAGLVHGREFVMDADSTRRIGVANLEALRSGAAMLQRSKSSAPQADTEESPLASGASGTAPTNIRIINTFDPAIIGDYLATPEGEQVLVNTMRRNSDQVRAIVNNA